jgi:hypothetical protein
LKELQAIDELLQSRESKLISDRKIVDDKLETVKNTEDAQRLKETELEKRSNQIRMKEAEAVLISERYSRLLADLEVRESQCQADMSRQQEQEQLLNERELRLNSLQEHLNVMEIRLAAVESREDELQQRIVAHAKVEEEFYSVKVAMISARHAAEISELEALVAEQLKVVANFQEDLDKTRSELKGALQERAALEAMNKARALLIEKLTVEMSVLNSDRKQLAVADHQQFSNDVAIGHSAIGMKLGDGDIAVDDGQQLSGSASSQEVTNTQTFLSQLGATQRMLGNILEKHKHGVPDTNTTHHTPVHSLSLRNHTSNHKHQVVDGQGAHADDKLNVGKSKLRSRDKIATISEKRSEDLIIRDKAIDVGVQPQDDRISAGNFQNVIIVVNYLFLNRFNVFYIK